MTFKSIHFFWTTLAVITIIFTFSLFAQKPEVVYDKDIQVVDTVVPPEELKEKIVAEVKHEELK